MRLAKMFPLLLLYPMLSASTAAQSQTLSQTPAPSSGPWVYQDSQSHESLRGIVSVGGGVAWISGAHGVVRRTEDGGDMWLPCSTPPGAEALDFRGIQAWDAETAILMSSGPGDASRMYKTTDGCRTWTKVFTNPLKDGFYDALYFLDAVHGVVLGDPVGPRDFSQLSLEGRTGTLPIRLTDNSGYRWIPVLHGGVPPPNQPIDPPPGQGLTPLPGEAFFAASNSSMTSFGQYLWIGTSKGRVIRVQIRWQGALSSFEQGGLVCGTNDPLSGTCPIFWPTIDDFQTPILHDAPSAGIFSVAFRDEQHGMVVGGDYKRPDSTVGTAAWTADGGKSWTTAAKPPHGYRSSVAWDARARAWIAAGTNGSDISYDDGKHWAPLDYGKWNALSLPWIVGPEGRVAKLGRLPPQK